MYVHIMYSHGFLSLILSHYSLYTVGNKDKLGDEDVGQPGILAGDTRAQSVSVGHPGITSKYSWLSHI